MSEPGNGDKVDKKGKKKKIRPDVSPKALMKKIGKKIHKKKPEDVKTKMDDDPKTSKESLCSEQNSDKDFQETQEKEPDIQEEVKEEKDEKEEKEGKTDEKIDEKTEENIDECIEPKAEINGTSQIIESIENPATTAKEPEATGGLKRECLYKILVIGELGTGKTSIIKRYVHQFFSQHYRATIGVDFALKVINWDPNTIIRVQLWDIAGQERFGNMTRVYYKEAVGAFIVFDVTRAATFDAVTKWKQDLDAKVQLADGSPIPCILLANKCDQQKEGLVNNPNKMKEYCEEHKFSAWFETSAKENLNVEEAAKALVSLIVNNDASNDNGRGVGTSDKFPLDSTDSSDQRRGCSSC